MRRINISLPFNFRVTPPKPIKPIVARMVSEPALANSVLVKKVGFEGALTKPSSAHSFVSRELFVPTELLNKKFERAERVGLATQVRLLVDKPERAELVASQAKRLVKLDNSLAKQAKLLAGLADAANLNELLAKLDGPQAGQAKIELAKLVKQVRRTELDELIRLRGRGYPLHEPSDAEFKRVIVKHVKQLKQVRQGEQAKTLVEQAELKAELVAEHAKRIETQAWLINAQIKKLGEQANDAKTLVEQAKKDAEPQAKQDELLAKLAKTMRLVERIKVADVTQSALLVADSAQRILEASLAAQAEGVVSEASIAFRTAQLPGCIEEIERIVEGRPLAERAAPLSGLAKLVDLVKPLGELSKPLNELDELHKPAKSLVELAELDTILTKINEPLSGSDKDQIISRVLNFKRAELAEADKLLVQPVEEAKLELVKQVGQVKKTKQAELLVQLEHARLLAELLVEQDKVDGLKVELVKLNGLKVQLARLGKAKLDSYGPEAETVKQAKTKLITLERLVQQAELAKQAELVKQSGPAELFAELTRQIELDKPQAELAKIKRAELAELITEQNKQALKELVVSRKPISEEEHQQVNDFQTLPKLSPGLRYLEGLNSKSNSPRPSSEESLRSTLRKKGFQLITDISSVEKAPWWSLKLISASLSQFKRSISSFKEVTKMSSSGWGFGFPANNSALALANRRPESSANVRAEGSDAGVNDSDTVAALGLLNENVAKIASAGSAVEKKLHEASKFLGNQLGSLEETVNGLKQQEVPLVKIENLEQQFSDLKQQFTQLEDSFIQHKAEERARMQETAELSADITMKKLLNLLQTEGTLNLKRSS